jgi:predicted alpha/beta superfamily hydrolase
MLDYKVIVRESKRLNREVKLYIHLPASYNQCEKQYPVLYMHDGEIIFNDFDNDESEVGILEKYSHQTNGKDVILVGIGSGEGTERNNELVPFQITRKNGTVFGGKTDAYLKCIVEELMPFINHEYRTKTSPQDTGMLGISLGGLATLYAMTNLTTHFSRFAFVSSAHYRVQKQLIELFEQEEFENVEKLYSDVGTIESANPAGAEAFVKTNQEIYELLKTKPKIKNFKYSVIENSKHETIYWNERFTDIIDFMFD